MAVLCSQALSFFTHQVVQLGKAEVPVLFHIEQGSQRGSSPCFFSKY